MELQEMSSLQMLCNGCEGISPILRTVLFSYQGHKGTDDFVPREEIFFTQADGGFVTLGSSQ